MKKIIISRTDSLGDVVLTLPLCGVIKAWNPSVQIIFLGKSYTRPLIERCSHIDTFLEWDNIASGERSKTLADTGADAIVHVFPVKDICTAAQRADIPWRIATARRWFTWFTCNRLINLPRKNSQLHEAQLNLLLLRKLGIDPSLELNKIPEYYGLSARPVKVETCPGIINVILHPRSRGSAREWGLDNYGKLIDLLPAGKFHIFITGTAEDGQSMRAFLDSRRNRITDMTGKLSLDELIDFIAGCDALVAASTGPLHIAAALGRKSIGLFAPIRPMHPGRWAPLGKKASYLVTEEECSRCRKGGECHCIQSITPESVFHRLIAS